MLAILDRRGHELLILSGSRVALGIVELASALAMVIVAIDAAPPAELWPAPIVLTFAMLAVALPDSEAGLLTLLAYGGWWFIADRSATWVAVVVASLAAFVFHLALAHAAAAPTGAVIRASVLRAVLVDAGMVLATTGIVALGVAGIRGSGLHAPTFLIGVALVLIGLLPWVAALSRESA